MSVTDPLIKELKGYVLLLTQEYQKNSEFITDENNELVFLCETIEKIFQKGCTGSCWDWLNALAHEMEVGTFEKSFGYIRAVETVRNCLKVKTNIGRLRLLIRCCLVNKCLHVPVETMVRLLPLRQYRWYHAIYSILGHEILGEIFLSVVLQCSTLHFKLNISNARFLDTTWLLPTCNEIEFVPCSFLGVAISFLEDKAVVVNVEENSVASEDDQIEVCDVLDELNGTVLTSDMRGKLSFLMTKAKNKPIKVKLIKCRRNKNGVAYGPILALTSKANINLDSFLTDNNSKKGENVDSQKTLRGGSTVNYVGKLEIGAEGDVKQIAPAIAIVVEKENELSTVRLECQELGLKITEESTGKHLFNHSYMEISSCGQTQKYPRHFAYIAGNDVCNVAKLFTCYVFETDKSDEQQVILQSIGQGFQRTHYAV